MSINQRIFLSPPHMGGEEIELVTEAFKSNYIAPLGPMVDTFEKDFSKYSGFQFCLALNSGTAAMHLALRCLGIGKGDIVIASSLTFIGSVSPILFQGATPVFIDCEKDSWNMDPIKLAEAVDYFLKKGIVPKAVVPTDLYGQCANYDALKKICEPHGIPLIFDSAEAAGAFYKGKHAGSGAKAAIFSFNGNKIITTSGGGILASNDEELISYARKLSTQAREPVPYYEHNELGYNYRMSNISAAIGIAQLKVLNKRVERKREIFNIYKNELGSIKGISFIPEPEYSFSNRWLSVMIIDRKICGVTPEEVRLLLENDNIESRPVWKPMHMQPIFLESKRFGKDVSESFFRDGLCLPSGTALTPHQLDYIIEKIKKAVS